ncbi:MAG: DUF3168 domain-containing protein [Pseudomonadota bacterium]
MSYAMTAALQAAVFQRLEQDGAVQGYVSGAIYDAAPAGDVPGTYVVLGQEEARDRSDSTTNGAQHDFTVSVVSEAAGFQVAKAVASAISDSLVDADLVLSRGRLVSLRFLRARAERFSKGSHRKIDIRFRAVLEDI